MRTTLVLLGYSLAAGILMTVFMIGEGLLRYVFSLGALLLGIQFFKRHEGKGMRIGFVALVVFFALLLPTLYVALALANGWYLNPEYTKGIER